MNYWSVKSETVCRFKDGIKLIDNKDRAANGSSKLIQFMLWQSEKGTQTTPNRFWEKLRIRYTEHFTLKTISSDEDLVEMDDEHAIRLNKIILNSKIHFIGFYQMSYVLKIKVSKKGGVIKIRSVKIYAYLIKVKFVFITLIKWYLNFM